MCEVYKGKAPVSLQVIGSNILEDYELTRSQILTFNMVKSYQLKMIERPVPEVHWFYGPTGAGKDRAAHEFSSFRETYEKDGTNFWQDYSGEETIIISDVDDKHGLDFRTILRLTDRYQFRGNVKGGHTYIVSKRIVFTSDVHPQKCLNLSHYQWKQLERRIKENGGSLKEFGDDDLMDQIAQAQRNISNTMLYSSD